MEESKYSSWKKKFSKFILLGDYGVGKSSICYYPNEQPLYGSIGADFVIFMQTCNSIKCFGKNIRYNLWDTNGAERFWDIRSHYYKGAMGVLLVFDLTKRETLININNWIQKFRENTVESIIAIILVGNKSDLKNQREVSYEEAKLFADELGVFYLETSVKLGLHVSDLAQLLIKMQYCIVQGFQNG